MIERTARKPAPSFSADASSGRQVTLADYRGKYLVLYFFPRAFTLLCTRETIGFRDAAAELRALGAELVGVSADPLETQCNFASHYQVGFPIVSDPASRIARAYGAVFPLFARVQRVTFIIDPEGRIAARNHHELRWHRHIADALALLRAEPQR